MVSFTLSCISQLELPITACHSTKFLIRLRLELGSPRAFIICENVPFFVYYNPNETNDYESQTFTGLPFMRSGTRYPSLATGAGILSLYAITRHFVGMFSCHKTPKMVKYFLHDVHFNEISFMCVVRLCEGQNDYECGSGRACTCNTSFRESYP